MCCNPCATNTAPADETLPSVDVVTAANRRLREAGIDAHNVTGGIIAWAEARLPADFS